MLRMDHVVLVVRDLDAAVAFFTTLGLENDGGMPIEGEWVDRINNIEGLRCRIVMMKTPDGLGRLELTAYDSPEVIAPTPENAPPNTLGLRSVMFEVDDLDASVERMLAHGATLVGEVVQYETYYRLCYLRGPEGVIVALAEAVKAES